MKKKTNTVCVLMRHNTIFFMVLWQRSGTDGWHLTQTATFSSEEDLGAVLKPLLDHYGRHLHMRWVVHPEDGIRVLINDNGLTDKALARALPHLLAEHEHIDVDDHLLLAVESRRLGYVHVLGVSRFQLQQRFPSWITLEQCSVIDSYDYSLANAVLSVYDDVQTLVLLEHNRGVVRCLLVDDYRLRDIQETSLLEENSKTMAEQLTQRLCHYFSDYREKPVVFMNIDRQLDIPQLPEPWRFLYWGENKENSLQDFTYLPLIGSGLRYVNE